jgi:hypothetical protein
MFDRPVFQIANQAQSSKPEKKVPERVMTGVAAMRRWITLSRRTRTALDYRRAELSSTDRYGDFSSLCGDCGRVLGDGQPFACAAVARPECRPSLACATCPQSSLPGRERAEARINFQAFMMDPSSPFRFRPTMVGQMFSMRE